MMWHFLVSCYATGIRQPRWCLAEAGGEECEGATGKAEEAFCAEAAVSGKLWGKWFWGEDCSEDVSVSGMTFVFILALFASRNSLLSSCGRGKICMHNYYVNNTGLGHKRQQFDFHHTTSKKTAKSACMGIPLIAVILFSISNFKWSWTGNITRFNATV